MEIAINGKMIIPEKRTVNYNDIIKLSGESYREDYSVTCTHPTHKAFIVFPGCPDFDLLEGMRFSISLTGGA